MTSELKCCPFCGEQCAVLDEDVKWSGYQPSCLEVRTGYDSSPDAEWRTEAIAVWNRRAEQAAEVTKWRDKYNELGRRALEQVSDLGTKLGRTEVELDAAKADLQGVNRELAKFKALAETLAGALEEAAYSVGMSSYDRHKVADKALLQYKEARDD